MKRILLIDPSGPADASVFSRNVDHLQRMGFQIDARLFGNEPCHRLSCTGVARRATLLNQALADPEPGIVMAARGGYGASDLLDLIDWEALKNAPPKLLVGFSDISALAAALLSRLHWPALHAPMPGSSLWHPQGADVAQLTDILVSWPGPVSGSIGLDRPNEDSGIEGTLMGGCFSVLSDLVATPYLELPRDTILFLEDVNERAPQWLRLWNRWRQTGITSSIRAVVLGALTHQDPVEQEGLGKLTTWMDERAECPVYKTGAFGHVAPNMPLMIGARAVIRPNRLEWKLPA